MPGRTKRNNGKKSQAKTEKKKTAGKKGMPARTWNPWENEDQKKKALTRPVGSASSYEVAQQLARAEGARGVDGRSAAVEAPIASGNVTLKQQDGSVNIQALTNIQTVSNVALGAILDAVNRGWFTQTDSFNGSSGPQIAYNAWVYLTQSFVNTMMGTYPTLQSAPDWFWHICDALKPKDVPFKTASATYSWMIQNYDPSAGIDLPTLLPYDDFNAFTFGSMSTATLVNGFPVLIPVVYNQDIADRAIQSLFGFYPNEGMTKRVPCSTTDYLKQDVSAFAASYSELGNDRNGLTPNAFVATLFSETKIRCPILAKFAFYANGDLRGIQETKRLGGGSQYLIPRVMEFTDVRQFSNKCPPNIKYYNFDEYFEILSLALAKAMTILQTGGLNPVGAPTSCPLTSLDVQLLLRQAMLPTFSNHMSQTLVLDPYSIRMAPFSVCSNGYSDQAGSSMRLPLVLAEFVRSAKRKVIIPNRNWSSYQLDHVPVLARPANLPQLGNMSYTVGENTYQVFAVNPLQQDFRLIDLVAFPANSGATYFSATGKPYMTMLAEWNKYMSQIENALAGVAAIGTESGIRALWSNPCTSLNKVIDLGTLVTQTGRNVANMTKKPPSTTAVAVPVVKKKEPLEIGKATVGEDQVTIVPEVSIYEGQARTACVSSVSFLSSTQKYMRLNPQPYVADQLVLEEYVSRFQTNYGEGFRINYGQDSKYNILGNDQTITTISVFSAHSEAADLCVRSPLGGGTEIEAELMELAKSGRGGFFTSIAGFLAEDVFGVKGAKQAVASVGQALGI